MVFSVNIRIFFSYYTESPSNTASNAPAAA
jgi:hypothetical protein